MATLDKYKIRLLQYLCYVFAFSSIVVSEGLSAQRELHFLNWSDYCSQELIQEFEKEFNVKVKQSYFEFDDSRTKMLVASKGRGYDVILAAAPVIPSYIDSDWIEKIPQDKIPNRKYLDPKWVDQSPSLANYSVPYLWGTIGIAYRSDLVKSKVDSWGDILKPDAKLKKRILMLDDKQDTVNLLSKYLGKNVKDLTDKDIVQFEKILLEQKPNVLDYSYVTLTEKSELVSGHVWMTMVYNGDGITLMNLHPKIKYVIPKEGSPIWVDHLFVAKHSQNKDLAFEFINFLNRPKNAAKLAETLNFATPNLEAKKHLNKATLENKAIYPSEETLKKSIVVEPLPIPLLVRLNSLFAKIKQKVSH